MNNPFLTRDVSSACDQARVYYLDMLARKQMHGGTPISDLEVSQDLHRTNLDTYWEQAERAAFAGDVRSASTQFSSIVTEWGLYKAHQDLISAYGTYLDPADPDTVDDFVRAIEHKVVFLATELINTWNEGERQRKSDLGNLYMQRDEHLFGVAHQMIQDHGHALNQAHQYNQQYADVALRGAYQAQEGVRWMMQNAEAMYAHVQVSLHENLNAQKATTENIVQHLPREMERAQARIQLRGCMTRGLIVILLMLACPATLTLAYFILTQVVLRH
jgi:hypothetical protein